MPLDLTKEDSILEIIYNADMCIQYTDSLEAREEDYEASERAMTQTAPNENEFE